MPNRATVLIVDDEVSNIEIMNAVLEDHYEICFATSGEQALEVARTVLPDIILLDVMMPGVDGYEVCVRLKNDRLLADVPVIFTTGLDDQEAEVRGLSLGAIDYVTKPINPVVLRARVSNHIELKRLRDQLAQMAVTDALTGLSNRRQLEVILTAEISRLAPAGAWLSVIMLDIDFFKQLNDCYGHQTGDQALVQVAQALAQVCDKCNDLVARYGGEEFVVLLPKVGLDIARQVAERFRRLLQEQAIPHARSPFGQQVTVSIGAGSLVPQPGQDCAGFVHAVDQLLYAAKNAGRNRVVAQAVLL